MRLPKFLRHSIRYGLEKVIAPANYTLVPRFNDARILWLGLPDRPIHTVLDIGACRGGFASEILMPRFPQATIHSFEPSPLAFAALKEMAWRSGGRIVAHHFGLGEREETLPFHSSVDSLPSSSLLPATERNREEFPQTARTEPFEVSVKVLDEVAPSLDIEDELLVKIDVQGFEDRVLRGGRETIARAVACIIEIQTAVLYEGQPSFRDIFLLMDQMGFDFSGILEQFVGRDGGILYYDAVFIKKTC